MHYIMGIWVFVQGGVDRLGGLPSWMIAAACNQGEGYAKPTCPGAVRCCQRCWA